MADEPLQFRVKVWLESGEHAIGPGQTYVLELLAEHGTLREAARVSGMSYRHAWNLMREAENCLGFPLVEGHPGGPGGGRTSLTPRARALLDRWRQLREEVEADAKARFEHLFPEGRVP